MTPPHQGARSRFPRRQLVKASHLHILEICSHHDPEDGGDVHGDRLPGVLSVRLDPGVLHAPDRVLDFLGGGQHRVDHLQLLLQPVEGLYLRHHGGLRLQGLPLHAGPAG